MRFLPLVLKNLFRKKTRTLLTIASILFPRFAADAWTFLRVFDDAVIVQGSAEEWRRDRASALVGEKLLRKHGWKFGGRVVAKGTLYPVNLDLTIKAVYSLPYENSASVFFHREYLEEAWPPFRGMISTIWTHVVEIAVMRTLGYTRAKVILLILCESLVMALAGAALGFALFAAAFSSLKNALLDTRLAPFAAGMKISPGVLALAVGTAILIGLLAALVPALRSARRRIVDGLRFTG